MSEQIPNLEYVKGSLFLKSVGLFFGVFLVGLAVFFSLRGIPEVFIEETLVASLAMLLWTFIGEPIYSRNPESVQFDHEGLRVTLSPSFLPKQQTIPWSSVFAVREVRGMPRFFKLVYVPPGGIAPHQSGPPWFSEIVLTSPSEKRIRVSSEVLMKMATYLPKQLEVDRLVKCSTSPRGVPT